MEQDGGLWSGVAIGAAGTTIVGVIMAGLTAWRKYRSDRAASAADDLAVDVKVAEAMDKERRADADYQEAEDQRVVAHWKALNAEMSARFTERWNEIQATVCEQTEVINMLRRENLECQKSDARKSVEIEHLRESITELKNSNAELRQSNIELRTRVSALERKSP